MIKNFVAKLLRTPKFKQRKVESKKKLIEMGKSDVNQYKMWIKFTCTPMNTI